MKVFVDTNVWIDYFSAKKNRETDKLADMIETGEEIFSSPIIIQEILQGCKREDQVKIIEEKLQSTSLLPIDYTVATHAARLYRELRKKGVTSGSIDLQIASLCLIYKLTLLTTDKDFQFLEKTFHLKVFR